MTQPLFARRTGTRSSSNKPRRSREGGDESTFGGRGARFAIKRATADQHDLTEAAFAPYDLGNPVHYRAFLTAHAAALPGPEIAITGRGWTGWQPRFPQLADDLAALGAALPEPMIGPAPSEAGVWGIQYVIEGSRLGGRVLIESVYADAPCRYLSAAPTGMESWQAFCAALDANARANGARWLEEAVSAAIETFRQFQRAAGTMAGELG